jgi:3-hydroxyacyl-[acyl-carrier-protein] dehydratase
MRWFWIDRFTEFISGVSATAIKNVSLGDECLHECYFDSHLAGTLVLEGLAQTGGMLVGETTDFSARLVLGKVSRLTLHDLARPGDTLRYQARISMQGPEGALISATSHVGDKLQAEAELFLAILPPHQREELFQPRELARLLRMLRVYEVGRTADGRCLEMPDVFLKAEESAVGTTS